MKKPPKISVVILNYNGLHFLKKCLQTFKKQTYSPLELIVVDNNSTDGSIKYLKQQKNITLIMNKENYGFAKANNIGAKVAIGKFLFFLNNDTELFEDTIENLIKCYKKDGILSARQIPMWDKKFEGAAGGGMDLFGYPYLEKIARNTKVFFADGATFFIKKNDFFIIGMFDEELFIFEEDIDFCWRAQLMGYQVYGCWEAKVYHYSGGTVLGGANKIKKYSTSYFRRYLNERNIVRNILKNYSFPLCIIILSLLLFLHAVEIVALTILMKWRVIACYLEAYLWNIENLKNTLEYRKKIQKKRKISDFVLLKKMYWSYSKFIAFLRVGIPQFKD